MRIGIDLGGTKIEAIALQGNGAVLDRRRVATPRDYDGTIAAIVDLVLTVEQAVGGRCTVGVGIPGAISTETSLVKNANSTWLIGRALPADLEAALRRKVRVMNDANCFVLSEATDGAAAGADVVFGVILGTGVGGGITVGGRCLDGPNRIAGEWGHNPLPGASGDETPGPSCYCGRNGCIETWVSGPGLEARHREATGQVLNTRQLVAQAEAGDGAATSSLRLHRERLARSLASVVNIVDPDVIVLGGGLSNMDGLAESVRELLPPYVFSDTVRTAVVRHVHGDSSGVRGAAWLWPA